MTQGRHIYLDAAEEAAALLAEPAVAQAWDRPSALPKLSVRGLAGHLAAQIFFIPRILAEPVPEDEIIPIQDYYTKVSWIGSDLDTEFNELIRTSGEKEAEEGPAALAERVRECLAELKETLPATPSRSVRRPTWGAWSITFDDFVTSRLLEVVVHSDDLAHSVGIPTPVFSAEAVETVVDLLSRIAVHRHGATTVIRALSRAERSPGSISAL
jgi:hypothetical protein